MIIIIINIIIISILTFLVIRKRNDINKLVKTSLVMVISGGVSNLIDRLVRGNVVDYIDINAIISYPVFNIADVFIVLGVMLIIGYILIKK